MGTAPLSGSVLGLSSGNFLDQRTAAEGHNRILVSGCPSFGVAVDEGNKTSGFALVFTTLEQAAILVLAVDDADAAILLDEGNGEEFAFGFSDQVVEFSLHGLLFLGFGFEESLNEFALVVKSFVEASDFVSDHESNADEDDDERGGEDERGVVGHLVCLVRCQVTGKECMKNGGVASSFWYFFENKTLRISCFPLDGFAFRGKEAIFVTH